MLSKMSSNKVGHAAHFVRWTSYTVFRSVVPVALGVHRDRGSCFKS